MDMMRERADAKDLTLRHIPSAEWPGHIRADAPKLRQVLINLLGNAIKYTERGTVTLRLDASPAGPDGRRLMQFCVEHTGTGIADEDRAPIFDAFVQGSGSAWRIKALVWGPQHHPVVRGVDGCAILVRARSPGSRFCGNCRWNRRTNRRVAPGAMKNESRLSPRTRM
jgi:light-regulated signal transduction histidine kinase (bacteriophytochrome)